MLDVHTSDDTRWPKENYTTTFTRVPQTQDLKFMTSRETQRGAWALKSSGCRDWKFYNKSYKRIDANSFPFQSINMCLPRDALCSVLLYQPRFNDLVYDCDDRHTSMNHKSTPVDYLRSGARWKRNDYIGNPNTSPARYHIHYDQTFPRSPTINMAGMTGHESKFGRAYQESTCQRSELYDINYSQTEARCLASDYSKCCNRSIPAAGWAGCGQPKMVDVFYEPNVEASLPTSCFKIVSSMEKHMSRAKGAHLLAKQNGMASENDVGFTYNPKFNHVTGHRRVGVPRVDGPRIGDLKNITVKDLVAGVDGLIGRIRAEEVKGVRENGRAQKKLLRERMMTGDGGLRKKLENDRKRRMELGLVRIGERVGQQNFLSTVSTMTGISQGELSSAATSKGKKKVKAMENARASGGGDGASWFTINADISMADEVDE